MILTESALHVRYILVLENTDMPAREAQGTGFKRRMKGSSNEEESPGRNIPEDPLRPFVMEFSGDAESGVCLFSHTPGQIPGGQEIEIRFAVTAYASIQFPSLPDRRDHSLCCKA